MLPGVRAIHVAGGPSYYGVGVTLYTISGEPVAVASWGHDGLFDRVQSCATVGSVQSERALYEWLGTLAAGSRFDR